LSTSLSFYAAKVKNSKSSPLIFKFVGAIGLLIINSGNFQKVIIGKKTSTKFMPPVVTSNKIMEQAGRNGRIYTFVVRYGIKRLLTQKIVLTAVQSIRMVVLSMRTLVKRELEHGPDGSFFRKIFERRLLQ
jgi:hypothetical protein